MEHLIPTAQALLSFLCLLPPCNKGLVTKQSTTTTHSFIWTILLLLISMNTKGSDNSQVCGANNYVGGRKQTVQKCNHEEIIICNFWLIANESYYSKWMWKKNQLIKNGHSRNSCVSQLPFDSCRPKLATYLFFLHSENSRKQHVILTLVLCNVDCKFVLTYHLVSINLTKFVSIHQTN